MSNERKWYLALRINTKTRKVVAVQTITDPNPTAADGVVVIPMLDQTLTYEQAKTSLASPWWAWVGPLTGDGSSRVALRPVEPIGATCGSRLRQPDKLPCPLPMNHYGAHCYPDNPAWKPKPPGAR